MNKKIFLPVMALALTFTACDMDKTPYDSIPDSKALETPTDFNNMRNSLYSGLRSCVGAPAFYNTIDIQGDEFDAIAGYSGAYNQFYTWSVTPSGTSEFETVYGNCQAIIARANFIIDGYNKCDMSNPNLFTPDAIANIRNIKGEAFFMRAFSLYELAQYFCADYDESTADQANSGVSYRLDYYPSSNAGSYPARKTLRETYKQINDDLDSAAVYINVSGEQDSYYVTTDVLTAFEARVALAMDDYATAAQKAVEVINTSTYTLTNTVSRMEDMWWGDYDTESLFKLAVLYPDEGAGQTGAVYLPYTEDQVPDYVPTQTVVDLYSDDDIRKPVFFLPTSITSGVGTSGEVLCFNKYKDEGYVYTELANSGSEYFRFMIEPKVIRISEMYLIAAEAYAMQNNVAQGAQYLNLLENARITGHTNRTYLSANELMAEIRNERQREFIGEGTRMLDLKRWNMGVTRGTPQQEDLCNLPGSSTSTALTRPAGDARFVWPIPQHEIDANPQVVQNPGY